MAGYGSYVSAIGHGISGVMNIFGDTQNVNTIKAGIAAGQGYTEKGADEMRKYYGDANGMLDPYEQPGRAALPYLQYMASNGKEGTAYDITASPFYQWQMQQGNRALDRFSASRGQYNSSYAGNKAMDMATQLGAQESDKQYNRLFDMYNSGREIAGLKSGNAMTTGGRLGNLYGQWGNSLLGAYSNLGQARLGRYENMAKWNDKVFDSIGGGMGQQTGTGGLGGMS